MKHKNLLCAFIIIMVADYAAAAIIPADRTIDWSQVGVEGGIPQRTQIRNCVAMDGAHADGRDTSQQIQSCINNAPANGVAYLPAGTYRLGSGIILKSQKTLRGDGIDKTILAADDIGTVVTIGEQYAAKAEIDIVSGYTKGSSTIALSDASSITTGSFIRVDELNDPSVPVTNVGYGECTWCGRDNGNRVRGQIVRVTGKSGNSVTIEPAMYFTFKSSNKPQVMKVGGPSASGMAAEYAGIEDITIKNVGSSMNNGRIPLEIFLAANCWAKNIKIQNCGARCVQMYYDNYRFELRDSIITGCITDRYDSNDCYGTLIGMYNSGVLIENNIYESLADGPMFAWGASGNVVSYNFIYDAHRTNVMKTWFIAAGGSHHGAHTSYNLWEGNVVEALYFDQYWGSGSHNTAYRNRVLGKYMVDGIAEAGINNVYAIATEKNLHYQTYIGNVLGVSGYHNVYEEKASGCVHGSDRVIYRTGKSSSGSCDYSAGTFNTMLRHMNYDYVTNSVKRCGDAGEPGCQGSDASQNIPASLYLNSKPSWFGNVAWPPIGPDVTGYASKIPAQLRFEGTPIPMLTCQQAGGTCCSSGQQCSGTQKSASDCTICCVGTCQSQQAQTCSQQGGICCATGQTCSGTTKSTNDCAACCTGTCQSVQTCIAGDLNCDKKVDIFDLVLVAQNYGKTSGFDAKADANKDNKVDIFDLVVVAQNYGKSG